MSITFSIANSPTKEYYLRDIYDIDPGSPDYEVIHNEDLWPYTNLSNSNAFTMMRRLGYKDMDYCGTIHVDEMEPLLGAAKRLLFATDDEYIRAKALAFIEMFSVAMATNNPIHWG